MSAAPRVFTVENQGALIARHVGWASFAYTPMVREGTIVARITRFGWPNGTAVADSGVMVAPDAHIRAYRY
jgi:hypothetical protein